MIIKQLQNLVKTLSPVRQFIQAISGTIGKYLEVPEDSSKIQLDYEAIFKKTDTVVLKGDITYSHSKNTKPNRTYAVESYLNSANKIFVQNRMDPGKLQNVLLQFKSCNNSSDPKKWYKLVYVK
ncbi:hypothetical protein PHYBLDRAFT_165639 [Phycomyces blakesleeanus NRRL 1555(-)]|uniref:Uncharacterized protein n=1 Tax=Phycomyces blakesleeanus (strain ATCC 8743b / DSM 1359 / FGSC 10004 / NBRC 33097 / NRRL 1555) TaxID=763407 RepID=A0A167P2Z1_PHYB8|nr:hypothetical protein PHYBLDRAFT_165639 [Phycomyces blakesleeanus NRRL 1555(-)]OAD77149.1 hypothetical protein PHYBLDRAFT_165639 [Phycomyces blakesleeanus NRRL 1555(-)]|eukprot:XP_018295189.1 hypothetical protein PHYBLDRAFT_165639 [Phycomyces blakesleeanus NRRL 1555(-)]